MTIVDPLNPFGDGTPFVSLYSAHPFTWTHVHTECLAHIVGVGRKPDEIAPAVVRAIADFVQHGFLSVDPGSARMLPTSKAWITAQKLGIGA